MTRCFVPTFEFDTGLMVSPKDAGGWASQLTKPPLQALTWVKLSSADNTIYRHS